MTVNEKVVDVEKRISEAISGPASEACKLGCIGVHVGFTRSGWAHAECIFPLQDYKNESTFADYLTGAAQSIIAAKMKLKDIEKISPVDMAAYCNLLDQLEALNEWLDGMRINEGEDSAQE